MGPHNDSDCDNVTDIALYKEDGQSCLVSAQSTRAEGFRSRTDTAASKAIANLVTKLLERETMRSGGKMPLTQMRQFVLDLGTVVPTKGTSARTRWSIEEVKACSSRSEWETVSARSDYEKAEVKVEVKPEVKVEEEVEVQAVK